MGLSRILIVSDIYFPVIGGMTNFTHRLAWYLQKRGHVVQVMALSESRRTAPRVVAGVPVIGLASFPPGVYRKNNFRAAILPGLSKRVERAILAFAPDIIHVQGHYPVARAAIAIAKKYNIPVIGTNHSLPENVIHHIPGVRLPLVEKSFSRWAWRDFCRVFAQVDRVTTPTKTSAAIMRQNGFKKTILALSCGIDTDLFNPAHRDSSLLARYHLPADKPLLLFVGRLDKEKNIDFILRALSHLSKDTAYHFVICGRGTQLSELTTLAHQLDLADRVSFLGFVPDEDLPPLYALAHCFVIASNAELQSLVTMEAMASGLPVLAARVAALPELVAEGKNGYLFNLDNPWGLAKKIETIFQNPTAAKKMGQESRKIIQKHAITKAMAAFEKLYAATIAEKTRGSGRQSRLAQPAKNQPKIKKAA